MIADRDFSTFSYSLRDSGAMGGAGVNGLAAFEAQISVFLIGLCLVERRLLVRLGYVAVIAASIYCLLFALSRGGYAALLIAVIFLGLVRNRLLLLAVVGFLLVWQSIVPPAVRERVFMTTDERDMRHQIGASMGPRRERRGLQRTSLPASLMRNSLQWVHGASAVVFFIMPEVSDKYGFGFNGSTARAPWSSGNYPARSVLGK